MMQKMKNVEDLYQLSPLQQGMLFHTLYAPRSGIYCEQIEMKLSAVLDIAAFKRAWQVAVERHTILRTAFLWDGLEDPLQIVRQRVELPWEEQDLRGLSKEEQVERILAFQQLDLVREFDLRRAPLMRLTLFLLASDRYHFLWTHHHLLLDGWSVALLLEEISVSYTALRQGREPALPRPLPYGAYITWLQKQNLAETELYWRRSLADFASPTPLPGDSRGEAKQTLNPRVSAPHQQSEVPEEYDCAEEELYLSREATAALRAFARRHQLTLNTLAQGAWALLLSRYSGATDVVFGTTVSTRPADLPGVEAMIGLLINTLPSRVHVPPTIRRVDWLQQLQSEQAEARHYSYTPLVQIQGWSEVPRGQPLFESLLVIENYPTRVGQQSDPSLPGQLEEGRFVGEVKVGVVQTNYPLVLAVVLSAKEQRLVLRASYRQRRFHQETILRLLGHLQTLLEGICSQPEQSLAMLPLLTADQRWQLLAGLNPSQVLVLHRHCLHELFEAQVERTPDAVALVFEREHLTYQELSDQADRLAAYLRQAGVSLETPVGICFEQTPASIAAVLGVLKAGGMYVPLDPAAPLERLAALIQDAAPLLVLTQAHLLERVPTQLVPCHTLMHAWSQTVQLADKQRKSEAHPANAAYVLYTSGSTGKPKGVIVEHRQVVSYVAALSERVVFVSPASFAMLQPLTVDSCLTMLFPALLTGGILHLLSREKALDAEVLAEHFTCSPADYLKIAPSHLAALLLQYPQKDRKQEQSHTISRPAVHRDGLHPGEPQRSTDFAPGDSPLLSLLPRLGLIIGGEASQWEWAQQLRARLPASSWLYNHYGPTETTVGSLMFQDFDTATWSRALTPLGRPLANTHIYVLDRYMQVVPVGVIGELYLTGSGLARGYLARPDLTAERFLPDPFSLVPGARMYQTGDLVIAHSDGTLGFVGRNDEQVKIRGYRIEPGEIEAVLLQHPAVQEALVLAREEATGEKSLIAYVLPREKSASEQALRSKLRDHLNACLPLYMHPTRIVLREAFPLTIQGKVDRRALTNAEIESQPEEEVLFVASRNSVEEAVAQIWAEVLRLKQVGVYDNFFALGGHSLLATQILSRVREFFQIKLPLRTLFEAPTIAALAEAIVQRTIEEADSDTIAQILAQQE